MHQKRNILLNCIINIVVLCSVIRFGFYITSDNPNVINFIALTLVLLVVAGAVLYLIQAIFVGFVGEMNHVLPPVGVIYLPCIFYHFFKNNVKIVYSHKYSYFTQYDGKFISVYVFECFRYRKLDPMIFDGSPDDVQKLCDVFEKLNQKAKPLNGFDYKAWDGTLDDQAKRINTINKIIKS